MVFNHNVKCVVKKKLKKKKDSLSEEEKNIHLEKERMREKRRITSLTEEEKQQERIVHNFGKRRKWKSLSQEEKDRRNKKLSIKRANRFNSYSPEKKIEKRNNRRQRINKRIKTDVVFKLKERLRSSLHQAIKTNAKTGSAIDDLGCSIQELKLYLENLFKPWMNWDNWGTYNKNKQTWHIDHILPLASFNLENREELLKACHYTNLQPLLALTNLKKGDRT